MTEVTSHLAAIASLIAQLPESNVLQNGRSVPATVILALANKLEFEEDSISFGKVLLWLGVFLKDGREAISNSSLSENSRDSALTLYNSLAQPFKFPYGSVGLAEFKKAKLSSERESYIELLDETLQKDTVIFVPDESQILELTNKLEKLIEEFDSIDIPDYIKDDFRQNVRLYITIARKIPSVAHRIIAEDSKNLISWLLSSIPDNAKQIVSRTALTLNVLCAAFVAPTEISSAAHSYYEWYTEISPKPQAIEQTVAPKALPAPGKVPIHKPEV